MPLSRRSWVIGLKSPIWDVPFLTGAGDGLVPAVSAGLLPDPPFGDSTGVAGATAAAVGVDSGVSDFPPTADASIGKTNNIALPASVLRSSFCKPLYCIRFSSSGRRSPAECGRKVLPFSQRVKGNSSTHPHTWVVISRVSTAVKPCALSLSSVYEDSPASGL